MKLDTDNLQGNYKKVYQKENKLRPSYDRRSMFIKIRKLIESKENQNSKKK
jgi:hypothetical protein